MAKKTVRTASLKFVLPVAALFLTACSSTSKVVVESANQNSRVKAVIIHHTVADFGDSLEILTQPSGRPVSSHYLIPEPGDPSYQDKRLRLYQLVSEDRRAWHAGQSYWAGRSPLNDMSIGIELVNQTRCHETDDQSRYGPDGDAGADGNAGETPGGESARPFEPRQVCFYPDYPPEQIGMLVGLLGEILARHPEVAPTDIVGHSDIAPQRKIDPGPRFPWERLYRLGFGAWYDDETVVTYWERFRERMPGTLRLQEALHAYGYDIEPGEAWTEESRNVVRAFQMHFVPWRVTMSMDTEAAAILFALIDKYRPAELERLLEEEPDTPVLE
jgi:N-acetylmuramoyl-L-alanine amidase